MPRLIDQLPEPAAKEQPPKLFVMSAPRTGTFGLYKAFKMLGYRPYHMNEVCEHGVSHTKIFQEAIKSTHPAYASSETKPYRRSEFDKWFAGYDVIIEIPSFLLDAIYQAYGDEPDVRFLLTERGPDSWVRSVTSGPAELLTALDQPGPLGLSRHFDAFNDEFFSLATLMYESMAEGKGPNDPGAQDTLRRHYVKYIAKAKAAAPPGKIHVIKLEEGLDWDSICPFLGREVPGEPYPRGNDRGEFKQIMGAFMAPGINKAIMGVSAVVVPLIGLGAWALVKY
ncbi:P-loop containing nucleoside triphosphate hydrolase protein, partial [Apiospora marii]